MFLIVSFIISLSYAQTDPCDNFFERMCSEGHKNDTTGKRNHDLVKAKLEREAKRKFPLFMSQVSRIAKYHKKSRQQIFDYINKFTGHSTCKEHLSCLNHVDARIALADKYRWNFGLSHINPSRLVNGGPSRTFSDEKYVFMEKPTSEILDGLARDINSNPTRGLSALTKMKEQKIRKIVFPEVKKVMSSFVIQAVQDPRQRAQILQKISTIKLKFDRLSKLNDALYPNGYYSHSSHRFTIKESYLLNSTSLFSLVHLISHEIAHSFDPCNYDKSYTEIDSDFEKSFPGLMQCLKGRESINAKSFEQWNKKREDPNKDLPFAFRRRSQKESDFTLRRLYEICSGESKDPMSEFISDSVEDNFSAKRIDELVSSCNDNDVKKQLLAKLDREAEPIEYCHKKNQVGESFCDWVASHMIAQMNWPKLGAHYIREKSFSRGIANIKSCRRGNKKRYSSHPSNKKRIELFLAHPEIRKKMGCRPLGASKVYCSPFGKQGNSETLDSEWEGAEQ